MRIAIRPLLAMIALTAVPVATTNAAQSSAEVGSE